MNPTFKVIIVHEGREYDEYVGDASTKSAAEKKAVANFKKKHKVKGSVTAHADFIGSAAPIVMYPKFYPKGGVRPNGKPIMGMKMIREQIKLRELKYIVRVTLKTKSKKIETAHTVVMAHSPEDAMLKGKRELGGWTRGSTNIKWEVRRTE